MDAEPRDGAFVCLTFTDSGVGMDTHILSGIFEPFFTTKPVGKGTGLGLATVFGIIRAHHGWIEVESKPNHGTTFRLYFPASKQRAEKMELAECLLRRWPQLKVIYTSGYSPGKAGSDTSLLRSRNFLPKPYSIGKLAQFLRECIDNQPAAN